MAKRGCLVLAYLACRTLPSVSLSPFPVTGLPSLAKARAQTLNEYLQYSACCSQEKSLVFIRDQGRAPCPGSCAAKVAIA